MSKRKRVPLVPLGSITIRIKSDDGGETKFKVNLVDRLQQAFDTYAASKGVEASTLRFYDEDVDEALDGNETFEDAEIGDGDVVCVKNLKITVRVMSEAGEEPFLFKVNRTTQLQKMFDAYAARKGVEASTLRFYYQSIFFEALDGDETFEDAGIGDKDVVEVKNLRITVRVKSEAGEEPFLFKVQRTQLLQKVFDAYAARKGVEASTLRFYDKDNDALDGDTTCEDAYIEDHDIVRVKKLLITVRIKNEAGEEPFLFKVNRFTRLQKLFDAYAARKGVEASALEFQHSSHKCTGNDTAESLGLQDQECITVRNTFLGVIRVASPSGGIMEIAATPDKFMSAVLVDYASRVGMPAGILSLAPAPVSSSESVKDYCTRTAYSSSSPVRTEIVGQALLWQRMELQLRSLALQAISALPYYGRYHRYCKVRLDDDGPVFHFLSQQFHASLVAHRGVPANRGGSGDHWRPKPVLRITRIEQVQNGRLIESYRAERDCVAGLNRPRAPAIPHITAPMVHGSVLNEFFLYHGTSNAVIESICEGGFDPRRGGTNAGKLFGVGSYFAENASKADRYAEAENGERKILVARVCLGATQMTNTSMREIMMPPDRRDKKGPLDSVTAEKKEPSAGRHGVVDHREYIVYKAGQALPEYCISYVHEAHCKCARCVP